MKIGIVSLGLIGGSLFKCLVNLGYEVYGTSFPSLFLQGIKEQ